jgi:hypothetical protein
MWDDDGRYRGQIVTVQASYRRHRAQALYTRKRAHAIRIQVTTRQRSIRHPQMVSEVTRITRRLLESQVIDATALTHAILPTSA